MTIPFKTGDIIFVPGGVAGRGHIQMIYQGLADTISPSRSVKNFAIHAQSEKNFHIIHKSELPVGHRVFRYGGLSKHQQVALRRIADLISISSEYRLQGMGKLIFSTSTEGKYSKERLNKYTGRLEEFLTKSNISILTMPEKDWKIILGHLGKVGLKLVSNATCAEAVILCYQLTARLLNGDSFPGLSCTIPLSARGSYPTNLRDYLLRSGTWNEITSQLQPMQGFGLKPKDVEGFGMKIKN